MSKPDFDDLRRRSDELASRLKAFRATMKPEPSTAAQTPMGPPLWSRQWFAELFWLAFVIAGSAIVGGVLFLIEIVPLAAIRKSKEGNREHH
jgi:hypothetical protein